MTERVSHTEGGWAPALGFEGAEVRQERLLACAIERDPQRPLIEARLNRLLQRWSLPRALRGHFVVSRRADCTDVMIEGNHRLACMEVLKLAGTTVLACDVYRGLSKEQEAQLWLSLDEGIAITPRDRIVVRDEAGEAVAKKIVAPLKEVGLVPHDVIGADQLERAYWGCGFLPYRNAVVTVHNAWKGEKKAFRGYLILALALVLREYRDRVDFERMQKVLAQQSALRWVQDGRAVRRRYTVESAVADLVVQAYNYRLSARRLSDWQLSTATQREHQGTKETRKGARP